MFQRAAGLLGRVVVGGGTPNVFAGVNSIFTAPLVADPGTKFEYGINTDWLGKVVEAASGVTLDVAVKEGITSPLGRDQTTFLRRHGLLEQDRAVDIAHLIHASDEVRQDPTALECERFRSITSVSPAMGLTINDLLARMAAAFGVPSA